MRLNLKTSFITLVLATVLTGCGGIAFNKPANPNDSLIIGSIDMSEASGEFTHVVMKKIKPASKTPYKWFWVKDNLFFRDDVEKGAYKMDNFKSFSGWTNTEYSYNFPKTGGKGEMDIKVRKSGIYYVGSWKFKKVNTGFFKEMIGKGKFELIRVKLPSELDILNKIKKYSKDDYWTNMINKRISQLKRKAKQK
ncbi:MAG: hypothetical protein KAT06_02970 [Gammaproteobacteria bacterium]|nr:hypothetical protein [Gammaproteobacteria bacterium]